MIEQTEYLGRIQYREKDGKLHKPNGPSSIYNDHTYYWYLNGKSHRYYGPCNWLRQWFIHGKAIKRNKL